MFDDKFACFSVVFGLVNCLNPTQVPLVQLATTGFG